MPTTLKVNIAKGRLISILVMTPSFFICYLVMQLTQKQLLAVAALLFCVCASVIIMDKVFHYSSSYDMTATFFDDRVELVRGRRKNTIFYSQIKEVSQKMVIDRSHDIKGYYNVKIKANGKFYQFFSGENYDLHLPFEKTDLFAFYTEFRNHGVKCC